MSAEKTIDFDSDSMLGGEKPKRSQKSEKPEKVEKQDKQKKDKKKVVESSSDEEEVESSSEDDSSVEDASSDDSSDEESDVDDDDAVSLSTTEILNSDPLYTILSQFFMTKDGKNIADILEEMNVKMKYLKRH
jgi:hypothetical protein